MSFTVLKILAHGLLLALFFLGLILVALPWLPSEGWFALISYVASFAPRWLLLCWCPVLLLFWSLWGRYSKSAVLVTIFSFLLFQDWQWQGYLIAHDSPAQKLRVLSINMGGGASLESLSEAIQRYVPDIVLMQEMQNKDPIPLFSSLQWQLDCQSHLCVASTYAMKMTQSMNRKRWGGWGLFAISHDIDTALGPVSVANVHFETPRPVFEGLRYAQVDWLLLQSIVAKQEYQTRRLSRWAERQGSSQQIIAGDFNMTISQSMLRRHLSSFSNALTTAGKGLNYTKYTKWHGVRIDHQLVRGLTVTKSFVIDSVGGDHRPIFSEYVTKLN